MEVYNAQHMRWRDGKGFANDLSELAVAAPPTGSGVTDLKMEATEVCYTPRQLCFGPVMRRNASSFCTAGLGVGAAVLASH